jgi:hypothetical protein
VNLPDDLVAARALLAELEWLVVKLDRREPPTRLQLSLLLVPADAPDALGRFTPAVAQHHVDALLRTLGGHSGGARARETAHALAVTIGAATADAYAALTAEQRAELDALGARRIDAIEHAQLPPGAPAR